MQLDEERLDATSIVRAADEVLAAHGTHACVLPLAQTSNSCVISS